MPITFGRHKKDADGPPSVPDTARPALNAHVVAELESVSKKKTTGVVEVIDKSRGGTARLYVYEGGLYSVRLEGYEPRVGARLVASGRISVDDLDRLGGVDDAGSGVRAVRAGLLDVDTLAAVHQEYLLASLGAVLALGKTRCKVRKGEVTDVLCSLPLPIEPLFDLLARRAERTTSTWLALDHGSTPATLVLRRTSTALNASKPLPELSALCDAADGASGLDTLAARTGLTRAEAVHLAALLVEADVLAEVSGVAPEGAGSRLAVPEAFGTVASVVPSRPVPEPEPEPVPEPEPEPVLERVPVPGVAIEPEYVSEPVPDSAGESAPVPAPIPASAPAPQQSATEPSPPPAAIVPDHVRQLRRELARTEVAELEEALREASAAERVAITQTAAIRARLAEARDTLGELTEEPTPDAEAALEP